MSGRLRAGAPDFRVIFEDGRYFTSDEGTWDDVPRGRAIVGLDVGGAVKLSGFDRYGFEWEAVARVPVGRSENGDAALVDAVVGEIVALRGYGVRGETVRLARVTARGADPLRERPAAELAYAAWRPA